MIAEKFLDRLEERGLLDAKIIASLRNQVAEKSKKVTPESIAKLLVHKGHLTAFQAGKLVSEVTAAVEGKAAATRDKTAAAAGRQDAAATQADNTNAVDEEPGLAPRDEEELQPVAEEEELGLAPDDDDEPSAKKSSSAAGTPAATSDEEEEIVELEDASGLAGGAPAATPAPVQPAPAQPTVQPAPVQPAPGLQPLDHPEGLTPLDHTQGLSPLGSGAGLNQLEDITGLEPLHGHVNDPLTGGLPAAAGAAAVAPAAPQKPKRIYLPTNQWDSKLLLIGGAVLLLLLAAFVTLYYSLTYGTASEFFQAAEEDYRAQSYSNAIKKYDKYLSKFPNDPNVSLARVRREMARLRLAVEGARDPQKGLDTAREVLPAIQNEESFSEARPELATLLPDIAERFAEKAKFAESTSEKQTFVNLTGEAMELVRNPAFIPSSLREGQQTRIDAILEEVARAQREIKQDQELAQAINDINQAIAADDTVAAYRVRKDLLKAYPRLERNEQLAEVVGKITEKEARALVKVVEEPLTPLNQDEPAPTEFRVALASRQGPPAQGVDDYVAFVLVKGAVYGLEATSGRMLRRRYVGYETRQHDPLPLGPQRGADALLVDARRNELLRLRANTGELVWRLPLGGPCSQPLVGRDRVLLVARSGDNAGRLIEIDPETGESSRHAMIAQPLSVGPGMDEKRPQIYLVGDHTNLYVLSSDSLACEEVFHLGHKSGSISVPAAMQLGHLFIAENAGSDYCLLHVLATDDDGLSLKPAQPAIRLSGHVIVPPVLYNRKVLVVTDRRAIYVLNVDPEADPPVSELAKMVATSKQSITGYPIVDASNLWIADQRLTKYEIQTTQGRLANRWAKDDGDTFVGPLQVFGDTVLSARWPNGAPGIAVSVRDMEDGQPFWHTDLGVPTGHVLIDEAEKKIVCVTAAGALFDITPEVFQRGLSDTPVAALSDKNRPLAFTQAVDMQDGRIVFASPADSSRILVYDPNRSSGRLNAVSLATPTGTATAAPSRFAGGLLLPLDSGQVVLVDVATGVNQVLPFEPPREAGSMVQWSRAALVGEQDREFVITDDRRTLYRVGIDDQPRPHLSQLAKARLSGNIVSPLAATKDTIYGVMRVGGSDVIVSFTTDKLTPGKEWPLNGRVAWGPERVGEMVFVASDADGLMCFEAGQKQRWTSPLKYGSLAGRPLPVEGDFVLAGLDGAVWRIAGDTGEELSRADVGEPLGTGPVAYGTRLLLSGSDGALHVIPMLTSG